MQHVELNLNHPGDPVVQPVEYPVVLVRTVEFQRTPVVGEACSLGRGGIALVSWVLWQIGEPARVDLERSDIHLMPTQADLIADGWELGQ